MDLSVATPVITPVNKHPFQATKHSDFASASSSPVQSAQDRLSIRFGNLETSNPDAATTKILDSLLPRLGEATDWQMQQLQDAYGESRVGYDLKFTLGETRYTLRHVYDWRPLPSWLKPGSILIQESTFNNAEDPAQKYPMDYERTFKKYWPLFTKVAMPILSERPINAILNQLDQITLPTLTFYPALTFIKGRRSLMFAVNDQEHYLEWDQSKGKYQISEKCSVSPEHIEAFWRAKTDFLVEQNTKRLETGFVKETTPIPTLEQFKETYRIPSNIYTITLEQFQQVYEAVKGPIGIKLAETLGIREDMNPRTLIRTIVIRLLNPMIISGVGYRLQGDRDEITYYPIQGQEGHDDQEDLFFKIYRYKSDDGTLWPYCINSHSHKGSNISLEVMNEQDAAMLDKVMGVVKTRSELNSITMKESFFEDVPLWRKINPADCPKDYTQEKADLTDREAQYRAELSQMFLSYTK